MAWPSANVNTSHMDSSTDDPSAARADIKDIADQVNNIINSRAGSGGVASLTTDATPVIPTAQLGNALLKAQNLQDLSDVTTARKALGGTSVGISVFTAASAAAARSAISAQQDAVCLLKAGGTMTGAITLTTPDPSGDFIAAHKAYVDASGALTGEIRMYGSVTPPTGWLNCDGTAVNRTTYADLFAVIGTTFGVGDGSSTFNLPDMRSRMPIGQGTGSGLTARTIGTNYGAESFTLAEANIPVHTHSNSFASGSSQAGGSAVVVTGTNYYPGSSSITINNTGSGTAKTFQGPSLAVNFMIKT